MTKILDVCCGSRMFYYDRNNKNVTYADCRQLETTLCDGRKLEIKPDVIIDFRALPYEDKSFDLVVFDPPHLIRGGDNSWIVQKYGRLSSNWQDDIRQAFCECFRVLKPNGTLIFKWNEEQIPFNDAIKLAPQKPLLGDKRGKTRWVVFVNGI